MDNLLIFNSFYDFFFLQLFQTFYKTLSFRKKLGTRIETYQL